MKKSRKVENCGGAEQSEKAGVIRTGELVELKGVGGLGR